MADRLKRWIIHDVELSRAAALSTVFIEVLASVVHHFMYRFDGKYLRRLFELNCDFCSFIQQWKNFGNQFMFDKD